MSILLALPFRKEIGQRPDCFDNRLGLQFKWEGMLRNVQVIIADCQFVLERSTGRRECRLHNECKNSINWVWLKFVSIWRCCSPLHLPLCCCVAMPLLLSPPDCSPGTWYPLLCRYQDRTTKTNKTEPQWVSNFWFGADAWSLFIFIPISPKLILYSRIPHSTANPHHFSREFTAQGPSRGTISTGISVFWECKCIQIASDWNCQNARYVSGCCQIKIRLRRAIWMSSFHFPYPCYSKKWLAQNSHLILRVYSPYPVHRIQ